MSLAIYAGRELGAYGYTEKPWYQPHTRLDALRAELDARGLTDALDFREAPPATDSELTRFHTAAYVARTRARCATDRGSLDRAPDAVNARSRRLLAAIGDDLATTETLAPVLTELDATLEAFAPFLQSEELVIWDADAGTVCLTDPGRALLADPDASLGGPTYARRHVEEAARWVCGAVIDATRRLATGELDTAFVPIAGFHHAHRDAARMYCLYNDSALALATALDAIEGPVAYIDVDIHHGDGVHAGFADEPRVVLADLHADPTAAARSVRTTERGTKLTVALGPGHDDASYLEAWEQAEAFVRAARPAFVVFEAGVDGLATDPMSNHQLTPAVFAEIARRVRGLAAAHARGRLLVLGGGGYELSGMARGWSSVVEALLARP